MKKNFNNADLIRKNVNSKYFLFYQLWLELTDEKTLDTYQFKIMVTVQNPFRFVSSYCAKQRIEKTFSALICCYFVDKNDDFLLFTSLQLYR